MAITAEMILDELRKYFDGDMFTPEGIETLIEAGEFEPSGNGVLDPVMIACGWTEYGNGSYSFEDLKDLMEDLGIIEDKTQISDGDLVAIVSSDTNVIQVPNGNLLVDVTHW